MAKKQYQVAVSRTQIFDRRIVVEADSPEEAKLMADYCVDTDAYDMDEEEILDWSYELTVQEDEEDDEEYYVRSNKNNFITEDSSDYEEYYVPDNKEFIKNAREYAKKQLKKD